MPEKGPPGKLNGGGSQAGGQQDGVHRTKTRFERFRAWLDGLPRLRLYAALLLITWASLTALIAFDSRPLVALGLRDEARGYEEENVAEENIYAPRNVTYQDPAATRQARREAASGVAPIYNQNPEIPENVYRDVEAFFGKVREVRSSDIPNEEKAGRIAEAAPFYLPGYAARALVFFEDEKVDEAEQYTTENLEELYGSTSVAAEGAEELPDSAITLSEAERVLSEAANRDASGELRETVEVLSQGFLEPDYVVDRQATRQSQEEAVSELDSVDRTIQQGELVVARGEVIDQEDLAQLKALEVTREGNPWTALLGVGLVVAAEMWVAWYFLERFGRRILRSKALVRLVLAASLIILFTALARAFVALSVSPYLIPLAGLSILGTILLGPRLTFLMVVVSSVNVGIIAGSSFLLTAALLLTSGFAIYTVVRVDSRTELLRAGLIIAAVSAVISFAVSLVGGSDPAAALRIGAYGLGNGLLSLMLAMMLQPLLENAFNILTSMKLLELSNQSQPLLQKLLERAPGTFVHSMQVGNLAEVAAERIGANALLARVGAYYHDIGKVEHPAYYIENQISGMNPHSTLSPALSARVIRRHVKDGVEIGSNWNLPQEILEIINQHHGTSRIEYFYRKAVENALDGEPVREEDFRYRGELPRSKEAGIVMLADSVEATVKSLSKPTPKRIEDIVADTTRHKLEDGQLDECELTMREVHEAGEAIREAQIGFLGPRIEYPESQGSRASTTGKKATQA